MTGRGGGTIDEGVSAFAVGEVVGFLCVSLQTPFRRGVLLLLLSYPCVMQSSSYSYLYVFCMSRHIYKSICSNRRRRALGSISFCTLTMQKASTSQSYMPVTPRVTRHHFNMEPKDPSHFRGGSFGNWTVCFGPVACGFLGFLVSVRSDPNVTRQGDHFLGSRWL